jgi:hypothetical protein
MDDILHGIAVVLLVIGVIAGIALLLRAIMGQGKDAPWGISTLWGLFIVCIAAGLILMALLLR